MIGAKPCIWISVALLIFSVSRVQAQQSPNDTIRLGAINEGGVVYPMILLPEILKTGLIMDPEVRKKREQLRYNIYVVYPYALAAARIFNSVNSRLDSLDRRRDRKRFLKSIDHELDAVFKEPLKNLSIDQGHVLIKLINRQTGQNCYSIIRELKGGISAVVWQSVGILFNNNLVREYDPEGKDKDIESIVRDLEASNNYRYQIYQQNALLKKVTSL